MMTDEETAPHVRATMIRTFPKNAVTDRRPLIV